jgi:hypothetical protein
MSAKTTRIISIVLMKLIGAEQVVAGLTNGGLGSYITLFGIIELISVALFLYPKTYKIGFLLICCYLGGALSIELASAQPPSAAIFLTIVWISVFLKDKLMFINPGKAEK